MVRPNAARPYKAFGYPVVPALYLVGASVLVIVLLVYRTQTTWPGFFIVLLGVPVMPIVASDGTGLVELKTQVFEMLAAPMPETKVKLFCQLPGLFRIEATAPARWRRPLPGTAAGRGTLRPARMRKPPCRHSPGSGPVLPAT